MGGLLSDFFWKSGPQTATPSCHWVPRDKWTMNVNKKSPKDGTPGNMALSFDTDLGVIRTCFGAT